MAHVAQWSVGQYIGRDCSDKDVQNVPQISPSGHFVSIVKGQSPSQSIMAHAAFHSLPSPHVALFGLWTSLVSVRMFYHFNHLGLVTKYNRMDTSSPKLDQKSCPYGFGWHVIQQAAGPMGRHMSTWGCEHWLFNPKVQNQRVRAMKYNLNVQLGYTHNPSTTQLKIKRTHQLTKLPTQLQLTNFPLLNLTKCHLCHPLEDSFLQPSPANMEPQQSKPRICILSNYKQPVTFYLFKTPLSDRSIHLGQIWLALTSRLVLCLFQLFNQSIRSVQIKS